MGQSGGKVVCMVCPICTVQGRVKNGIRGLFHKRGILMSTLEGANFAHVHFGDM